MGSIEIVKFKRWAVVKRYPDRSEIAFISESYEQTKDIFDALLQFLRKASSLFFTRS